MLKPNEPEAPLDITKLRYVLYARKSTTDETRQVRSIPDQVSDCQKLAADLGLRVVKVLKETKSAKVPNQRPVFRQMVNDIKRGTYQAILAWNPDRLSRNMLEAGEIIDLIDQGIIKDLKFKTHFFTPDANGLMLLGMSFVLSKQYSDDLSQKVSRGVRNRFQEGKTPTPKHGYINNGSTFRPDEKNYRLICDAWQMRLQGESLEIISDYMSKNGYGKIVKKDKRVIKMSPKILSDVFRDSFYYGALVQANQTVDLRELDSEFEPVVTEEQFNQVQLLSNRRLTPYNTRKRLTFYPFKAIIICAYCNHNMVIGPSTGRTKAYLFARCDYRGCIRNSEENRKKLRNDPSKIKVSVRSKIILDFLYDFFTTKFRLTENDYKRYYERLDKLSDEKRVALKTEIRSVQGSITALEEDIKSRGLKIVDMNLDERTKTINEDKNNEQTAQKEGLEEHFKELKEKITDPGKDRLSLEEFLNLSKNAARKVKSGNPIEKDTVVREIFLNLKIDDTEVLSYQLKPAFEAMLKLHQSTSSRGSWIRTSGLSVPNEARYHCAIPRIKHNYYIAMRYKSMM